MRKKAAFTGGGTGGHVFPGLAVAEKVREIDGTLEIHWIGSFRGMEREIVKKAGLPFHGIPAGKLRRYFSLYNFLDIFKIAGGILVSLFLLKRLKAEILFSKGGFVSVPPVIAAKILGIPVITHDSDLDPGLATRISARFARYILVPYKESIDRFPHKENVIVTGNPVRREILQGDPEKGRSFFSIPSGKKILLVLGGSLGAQQINDYIASVVPHLVPEIYIVHQTGTGNFRKSDKEGYITVPFLTDILPHILSAADLVFSRAGAGTLWESGVTGKASLLVPLGRGSSRGDQIRNAAYFSEHNAAVVYEGDASPDDLYRTIHALMEDNEKREFLGKNAMTLCNRDASDKIASLIRQCVDGRDVCM